MARDIKDDQQAGMTEDAAPEQAPQQPAMNSIQLPVDEMTEKILVSIVDEDYSAAKQARDKRKYGTTSKGEQLTFDMWLKKIRDMYTGEREPKTTPWRFCSNRSLRIATSVLDLLHARLYPTIVNEDLLKWRPGEINDVPKVDRIQKLMHWWIWINSRLRSFFDMWTKHVIGYGDCLVESCWKVEPVDSGKTEEQPIFDEMGNVIQISKSRVIDLKESSASKVYMPEDVYLQEGSCDIQMEPVILEKTYFFRDLEQGEAEGKFKNIQLLREMIPYDRTSTQGMPEEEARRFQDLKIRNQSVKVRIWYGNFDVDGDGFPENVRILTAPEYNLYIGGVACKDITKSGKRPIEFTKFDNRIDRPDENWGEGVLEKVRELSEEIDAIFNQLSDSNTLSIMRPGFYDPSGDVDAPALNLAPNKITPISDPSRNVYFPDFQINIERLIASIRLVMEFVERLTAASSYVLGKESEIVGGSGTATRTNAIMMSAEQRFALPSERLREGAAKIINQHLDLLQLNIPQGLERRILGEKGEPVFEENELSEVGIAGEYDAYLLPDPSMGSMQTEREIAGMFYSILLQNVIVGTDPAKIYKVTSDLIKAHGKNPEEYLGPAPSQDMIDDPADENTLIVQGDFGRVTAQITENHMLHLQKHMELLQSPSLAQLPPHLVQQVVQFTQQHIQQHQQMMMAMQQIVQQFGGKGGKTGEGKNTPGASESPGMENVSGPLASAMQDKRAGEDQYSQSAPPG